MRRFGELGCQEITEGYEQEYVQYYLFPMSTAQVAPKEIEMHRPRQCGLPRQNRDEEYAKKTDDNGRHLPSLAIRLSRLLAD